DLKMNGSYYAFQAIGRQFGLGNSLMYLFAVVQGIYMLAQLAVILDASTRVFLSDVAKRFMPRQLTKMNEDGLPINGYWMTTILCALIMALGALLPKINDIFNWLLNLNGIVSPLSTCFLFWSYTMVRLHQDRFPTPAYTYLKNRKVGLFVG
ncbi:UNVERIFIED_CONTAM: amino acid permease, partial [Lactobacillus paragasseri]